MMPVLRPESKNAGLLLQQGTESSDYGPFRRDYQALFL